MAEGVTCRNECALEYDPRMTCMKESIVTVAGHIMCRKELSNIVDEGIIL